MITSTDRQGNSIPCRHSWHYDGDGLPLCKGSACQGRTVACGRGLVDCERHATTTAKEAQTMITWTCPKPDCKHTVTLPALPSDAEWTEAHDAARGHLVNFHRVIFAAVPWWTDNLSR